MVLTRYMQNYLASTTFALLPQWMEEDMRHSPESLGKLAPYWPGPAIMHRVAEEFGEVILRPYSDIRLLMSEPVEGYRAK